MNTIIPVLPSSGGAGNRLNIPSNRLSRKNASSTTPRIPGCPETPGTNQPEPLPIRIRIAAMIINVKFAAGPASAIKAARRGTNNMPDINAGTLVVGCIWYVAFLFSTTCHEASHALVAKLGGDDTAERGGQITLNPVPHIRREPWGDRKS